VSFLARFMVSFTRLLVAELLQQQHESITRSIGGVFIGLFEAPYATIMEQHNHDSKLDSIVIDSGSSSRAFLTPR